MARRDRDAQKTEIETGIPVPPRQKFKGIRAAMRAMQVGDSIVIDAKSRTNADQILGKGNYRTAWTDDKPPRLRVWREK